VPSLEHAAPRRRLVSTFVLSGFTRAALDLVFPALCPVCHTSLGAGRRDPLCGECWSAITRLGVPWCDTCGAAPALSTPCADPQRIVRDGSCAACDAAPPSYDYARSAAVYEGQLREALHALKFSGRRALAAPLGELAAEQCLAWLPAGIDALIPVPLAPERERERGFNQAALLARRIGRRLAVPTQPRWLARIRPTRPQSELAAAERRANVRGAFRASRRVAGRHVLVVDDILTTGATLDSCARALREAGARRVGVLTVARVLHAAL
jgi:ComF family protein